MGGNSHPDPALALSNNYDDQYVYDVVGNRLSKTHIAGGQTLVISDRYNGDDQIDPLTPEIGTLNGTVVYQTIYGFDANGSLTSITRSGSNPETDTYTFDLQRRLSTANINRTENGQSITISGAYTYDDNDFGAQSVVTITVGTGTPMTTSTQFLVDPNNFTGYTQVLEEQTNGSALPSTSYTVGVSVLSQAASSGRTYFLPDLEGSTRLVIDDVGTIVARLSYDAYGNLLSGSAGVVSPPITRVLYAGQLFDTNLQYYNLRVRLYDPEAARFTQMDPSGIEVGSPLTLDRYLYTPDNPVNFSDPSGLKWENDQGNGYAAHFGFSLYAAAMGKIPLFDFPIASVALVIGNDMFKNNPLGGELQPDVVTFDPALYWELKPISHKNSPYRADDVAQLARYRAELGPHGFEPGDQKELAPTYMPIGYIWGTDKKRYVLFIQPADEGDESLRGLIYYSVRKPPQNNTPQPTPVPVPALRVKPSNYLEMMQKFELFDEPTREMVELEYQEQDVLNRIEMRNNLILIGVFVGAEIAATIAVSLLVSSGKIGVPV